MANTHGSRVGPMWVLWEANTWVQRGKLLHTPVWPISGSPRVYHERHTIGSFMGHMEFRYIWGFIQICSLKLILGTPWNKNVIHKFYFFVYYILVRSTSLYSDLAWVQNMYIPFVRQNNKCNVSLNSAHCLEVHTLCVAQWTTNIKTICQKDIEDMNSLIFVLEVVLVITSRWHRTYRGYPDKGPYPPCLRMADRALLAGYSRYVLCHLLVITNTTSSTNIMLFIKGWNLVIYLKMWHILNHYYL